VRFQLPAAPPGDIAVARVSFQVDATRRLPAGFKPRLRLENASALPQALITLAAASRLPGSTARSATFVARIVTINPKTSAARAAQVDYASASLKGTVVDPHGAVISGATVTAAPADHCGRTKQPPCPPTSRFTINTTTGNNLARGDPTTLTGLQRIVLYPPVVSPFFEWVGGQLVPTDGAALRDIADLANPVPTAPAPPIDDPFFFVREHYLEYLARELDTEVELQLPAGALNLPTIPFPPSLSVTHGPPGLTGPPGNAGPAGPNPSGTNIDVAANSNQPIGTANTFQDLTWDTVRVSNGFTFTSGTATITVPQSGTYALGLTVHFITSTPGTPVTARVLVNNVQARLATVMIAGQDVVLPETTLLPLNGGDGVKVQVEAANTNTGTANGTEATIYRIG
jgi:hypothetical protein